MDLTVNLMRKMHGGHKMVIEGAVDFTFVKTFGYQVGHMVLAISSPTVKAHDQRFGRIHI